MAKLRKMLCSIDHPQTIALMRLIETQSKQTLTRWAVRCARERYLPLTEDPRLKAAVSAAQAWAEGALTLKDAKIVLRAATEAGRDAEGAVCQAASRAVAAACAVLQTPTNALGFTFYGAAAAAYHAAGLAADAAVYDRLAESEQAALLALLQEMAVPNEANPAKISWNC